MISGGNNSIERQNGKGLLARNASLSLDLIEDLELEKEEEEKQESEKNSRLLRWSEEEAAALRNQVSRAKVREYY